MAASYHLLYLQSLTASRSHQLVGVSAGAKRLCAFD